MHGKHQRTSAAQGPSFDPLSNFAGSFLIFEIVFTCGLSPGLRKVWDVDPGPSKELMGTGESKQTVISVAAAFFAPNSFAFVIPFSSVSAACSFAAAKINISSLKAGVEQPLTVNLDTQGTISMRLQYDPL